MSAKQTATNRALHWQQHIDAWQFNGGSKARYCRDNNLSYYVFNYWHAKLTSPKTTTNLVPVDDWCSLPVWLRQSSLDKRG